MPRWIPSGAAKSPWFWPIALLVAVAAVGQWVSVTAAETTAAGCGAVGIGIVIGLAVAGDRAGNKEPTGATLAASPVETAPASSPSAGAPVEAGAVSGGESHRIVDLRGAQLVNTLLVRADLRRADLRGASLAGADLSGANLTEARLGPLDESSEADEIRLPPGCAACCSMRWAPPTRAGQPIRPADTGSRPTHHSINSSNKVLTCPAIERKFDPARALRRPPGCRTARRAAVPGDGGHRSNVSQTSAMEAAVMIRDNSLYETCRELFAAYPLAGETSDPNGLSCSMVLMRPTGDDAEFCVLLQQSGNEAGRPVYGVRPWRGGETWVGIDATMGADVPYALAESIRSGVPLPRDGSLFGWRRGEIITALLVTYTEWSPETPEPSWAAMPLADLPEQEWPPFTGESLFGRWFWEGYRAGHIAALDDLIGATPETIFWADTEAIIGSNCCVVSRDVVSPDGYTLRQGRYVYHRVLRTGTSIPPLETLLSDDRLNDLAPQFA